MRWQRCKDFLFFSVISSLAEILCAIGLMGLAAWIYTKGAQVCTIRHKYKEQPQE